MVVGGVFSPFFLSAGRGRGSDGRVGGWWLVGVVVGDVSQAGSDYEMWTVITVGVGLTVTNVVTLEAIFTYQIWRLIWKDVTTFRVVLAVRVCIGNLLVVQSCKSVEKKPKNKGLILRTFGETYLAAAGRPSITFISERT